MDDDFSGLLAHSVTATGGHVESTDGTVECIALTFHYGLVGDLAMHEQKFMSDDALRSLIVQLEAIARVLGV